MEKAVIRSCFRARKKNKAAALYRIAIRILVNNDKKKASTTARRACLFIQL